MAFTETYYEMWKSAGQTLHFNFHTFGTEMVALRPNIAIKFISPVSFNYAIKIFVSSIWVHVVFGTFSWSERETGRHKIEKWRKIQWKWEKFYCPFFQTYHFPPYFFVSERKTWKKNQQEKMSIKMRQTESLSV